MHARSISSVESVIRKKIIFFNDDFGWRLRLATAKQNGLEVLFPNIANMPHNDRWPCVWIETTRDSAWSTVNRWRNNWMWNHIFVPMWKPPRWTSCIKVCIKGNWTNIYKLCWQWTWIPGDHRTRRWYVATSWASMVDILVVSSGFRIFSMVCTSSGLWI